MESSLTWSAGPPPLSVSVAIDVAGVVIFAASVAVLAATTAESEWRVLSRYRDRGGAGADPGWWDELERNFHRHLRRGGREQNPLRRAITRPQIPEDGLTALPRSGATTRRRGGHESGRAGRRARA